MSDSQGAVVSLATGERCGKTASLETTFADAAKARKDAVGEVYAIVGPDSSAEFRARLAKICPVLVDDDAKGVALLLDGKPAEWTAARAS